MLARYGVVVDRVITSNLRRTQQTAELVLERMKRAAAPRTSAFEALQEIRKGDYEALEGEDLHQAFLGIFRGRPASTTRFQGGESIAEVYQRVLPIVGQELSNPDWHCALWVLHGGINRALLSWWLCAPDGWLGNLLQQPACINLIDAALRPEDSIVRAINLWPGDLIQAGERYSTIEAQLLEYERGLHHRKSTT
jgi:probable phosphoglycerate mutase